MARIRPGGTRIPEEREPAPRNTAGLAPPWKPGQSGNPAGSKPGLHSKERLGKLLVADLCEHYAQHGMKAIERVCEERPADYLKIAVALLPKELHVKADNLSTLTDAEFAQLVAAVRSLEASGGDQPGGAPEVSEEQPDIVH